MKIALIGSAPTSIDLAPWGDPTVQIWGCSPGVYYKAPRMDEFFELHRAEVGIIGKPGTQKPWFSPEYVAWMGKQKRVWVAPAALEEWKTILPTAEAYPMEHMERLFGTYWWTSSLSYMMAMAIDQILLERETNAKEGKPASEELISLYGVDMAAQEEYGFQRAGCQNFIMLANLLGIPIWVPPESDLLRPMPRYGLDESEWWHIKGLARMRELEGKLAQSQANLEAAKGNVAYVTGALEDHKYHMDTWMTTREGKGLNPGLLARSPMIQEQFAAVINAPVTHLYDASKPHFVPE